MGTLTERLQLIVDATTAGAEARFQSLTGAARQTGEAADRAATAVASSADRVAQARLREKDAAGAVTVAQARLTELQESGRAKASQLAAAQERVEQAQRRLELATHGAKRATEEHAAVMGRTAGEAERTRRSFDLVGGAVRGLATGATLLVGGGLLQFAQQLPGQFAEGAKSAGQLATSMNATTEEAGAFLGMVGALGLDLNDLLEIQAEFAQKVSGANSPLKELGGQLQRNSDGTVNWANTLVDFLDRLQGVDDATERNRLGFAALGEEGYKQLSQLVNSGVDVRDALASIGTPFTDADIAAAAEYDAAMRQFTLTTGELERTLGRALLPALTTGVGVLGDVTDVVTSIPAPIAAATAAAVLLGRDGFGIVSRGGAAASSVMEGLRRTTDNYRVAVAISGDRIGASMGAVAGGMSVARTAVGGLASALGGPLGIALIATGVATSAAADGTSDLERNARDAAVELSKLEGSQDAVNIATRRTANELEENAGYWERSAAYVKGYQSDLDGAELAIAKIISPFQRLTMGIGDTADTAKGFELAIQEAKDELGAFGAQQAVAQVATKTLSDLIAEGTTSGEQFGTAVGAAAQAQADQARTSGLAQAAIDAYRATTDLAVQAQLELVTAQYANENAGFRFQQALDAANSTTDDAKTSLNEARQAQVALMEAAIGTGKAAGDAAVENAQASGQIVDAAAEAAIRADAMLGELRARLNTPGLSDGARAELQGIVDKLQEAKDRGDIEAVLSLTGAPQVQGELDQTTKDRDTTVRVESRNGPAVDRYLDGLAEDRLALIRVESRGGPAVVAYLASLAQADRLALIRVESRGGPAVDEYLDRVRGRDRLALIHVESRGGPAVDSYLDGIANQRRVAYIDVQTRGSANIPGSGPGAARGLYGAPAVAGRYGGDVNVAQLVVQVSGDGAGRISQQSLADGGRQLVAQLGAYTRQNGAGWLKGLSR